MCLWIECFGLHKHDDDDYLPPPSMGGGAKTTMPHDRPAQGNGYHQGANYGNGVHRSSPNQKTAAAAAEVGHKAANDARRGSATHAVARDAAFAYTAAAAGTLKPQPAWNGSVVEAQQQHPHHHYYYEREPVHREAAAMGHHYYTATTTADRERY